MRILKAYNNFYVAIIFLLIFISTLLAPFELHPKINYAIIFLLYVSVILFLKNSIVSMNRWLFFAIIALIPSGLLGFYMGWSYIDISADIARYLAPFLGYAAGILLFNHLEIYRILYVLYGLLALKLFSYYDSVVSKVGNVFQGGPLVEYASPYGLEVHFLYTFLAYFLLKNKLILLKNKIVSGFIKLLLIGYVIGFIVNPILIMSKARTITMLLSLTLIFIFFTNLKNKMLLIILASFVACTFFLYSGGETYNVSTELDDVTSRFQDTLELIETNDYSADSSTAYRVAEIKNVFGMLYDKLPYSIPFGFGSGALYYESYAEIKGGISQGNYRSDGGIHDIFFIPGGYLFRYGMIGLLFMFYFVVHNYRKISVNNVKSHQDTIAASLKIFIIISIIADLFIPVHAFGNFQYGFFIAMGIILQNKLKVQYSSSNASAV
tara:strand:- start:368 stop:1678 length:1311 start_codon:yes stop_codon:yes gene_type:complete